MQALATVWRFFAPPSKRDCPPILQTNPTPVGRQVCVFLDNQRQYHVSQSSHGESRRWYKDEIKHF